jgi:hypothetical protein
VHSGRAPRPHPAGRRLADGELDATTQLRVNQCRFRVDPIHDRTYVLNPCEGIDLMRVETFMADTLLLIAVQQGGCER